MANKRHQIGQDCLMAAVSIITVVKNNAKGLKRTLESAKCQEFQNWELIIVYGKSEDETISVANSFIAEDSRMKLVRQVDSGIYEAMNLGMQSSSSEFIWFMNSGDCFHSIFSLGTGHREIANSNYGFIVGGYQIYSDKRQFVQKSGIYTQLKFAFSRRGGCHQAMIFRKSAVEEFQNFDTRFRLAADYKLCLLLIAKHGAKRISDVLALMEPNGASDKNLGIMHAEKAMIRHEIFPSEPLVIAFGWLWRLAARIKLTTRRSILGKKHPLG